MKRLCRIIALILVMVMLCGCSEEKKEKNGEVINILMIGDCRSLYFAEELCKVADAADVNLRVTTITVTDAMLEDHWT